jgi:hypothetical protein
MNGTMLAPFTPNEAEKGCLPMSIIRSLLASSVMLGLASAAHAAVLYDNLNDAGGNYLQATKLYVAEDFIAGSAGTLADVKLLIAGDNTNTGGSVLVSIYDDAGGPADLVENIATILDASLPSSTTLYDIPTDIAGLTPGSPYWVVMQDTSVSPATDIGSSYGGSSIVWFTAGSVDGIGVAGGMYLAEDMNLHPNADQTFGPAVMCVLSSRDDVCPNVPTAPEPAGLGIIAVALAGLGMVRFGHGRA